MLTSTRLITFSLLYFIFATAAPTASGVQDSRKVQAPAFERVVHVPAPTANDSRYMYIPFDVPANAVRISVSYQYDRANGANTIDIGLFDARSTGSDTDPRGFRGWSGGRRSEFFVSRDEATPGYLRGALPAGKWRIILGLYRIAPAGVDVSVKVEVETSNERPPIPADSSRRTGLSTTSAIAMPRLENPRSLGHTGRWWKGDLHMHTVHSDGNWTIAELITGARKTGLDFIVITDHNTASHHEEIDRLSKGSRQPLVLRGEEITTYGGHTNAWGLPAGTWIDFRTRPGDNSRIANIAAQAHRAGALISINHPFVLCGGCSWSYDPAARDFDSIEVWNGPWDFTDEPAVKMWDKILQSGRRITAIASSDSHRPDTPIGKPATHVAATVLSLRSLLQSIRRGHVFLTDGTDRVVLNFEAERKSGPSRSRTVIGDELRLPAAGPVRFLIATPVAPPDATVSLISNGEVIQSFPAKTGPPQVVEIDCRRDAYFRLEVRDGTKGMLALTNPIYVRIAKGKSKVQGPKSQPAESNLQSPHRRVQSPKSKVQCPKSARQTSENPLS
jgi:hypothetical protein